MKNKIFLLLFSAVLLASCEREIDKLDVSAGSANFSKYVAVGNSMMAGYSDGALYHTGQQYSIPNIIAGQLKLAGGGEFVQPVVTSEYGVAYPGSTPKYILGYKTSCDNKVSLSPVLAEGAMEPAAPVGYAVNNFAIPGAKSFHLLAPGYGMMNPYYTRFASNPQTSMVVGDIAVAQPTFLTVWLGDNDVLTYALAGGSADSITSPAFFQFAMGSVLGAIKQANPQVGGVISNIPDVTSIPYFTTIPYDGLVLTKNQADSINMAMHIFYNLPFEYHEGRNPFLINDPSSPYPYKVRQMEPGELVLLSVPQDSMKCMGMGIIHRMVFPPNNIPTPYPIPDRFILTAQEVNSIETAVANYNTIISQLATTLDFGVVDMNKNLKDLVQGVVYDGINLNATFIQGGAFSLDGIHLNPRGNATAANYFIDAINAKYGSTIPHVDITKYPGIIFP